MPQRSRPFHPSDLGVGQAGVVIDSGVDVIDRSAAPAEDLLRSGPRRQPLPSGILPTLLCLSSGIRGAGGVERAVYASGQVTLDASADFPVGAAFCPPLLDVLAGFRIVGHFA